MIYLISLTILFFLFILRLPYTILSKLASFMDSSPRSLTVHTDSLMIIHGDVVDIMPNGYVWELYQDGLWIAAPGLNNAPEYSASSLLKLSNANSKIKLRRRVLTPGSCMYDSYYTVRLKSI